VEILRNRPKDAHKGNFGHLLVIAGSPGMTGAAGLSATSALRSGTGLVTLAISATLYPILAGRFTELMFLPLPEKEGSLSPQNLPLIQKFIAQTDGLLIGPGLGRKKPIPGLIAKLLDGLKKPLVLDADGLNALDGKPEILRKIKAPVIVTPHPGEMAALTGLKIEEIQKSRKKTALRFSREYNVVTVLKGHQTIVTAPEGSFYLNFTGNPGLATAGSGDVLAGLIAGLVVQGLPAFPAASLGVYLHGLAGDLVSRENGEASLLAGDLLEKIPSAIRFLLEQT
ncbi:MAG: NAD(P)H-hydrate dehydratase, partial [Candidatus Omnitrophica bacterium]|nr:NAD(P)H-hydrate dehydratase [Candidatus Omnitrophota bacterium]